MAAGSARASQRDQYCTDNPARIRASLCRTREQLKCLRAVNATPRPKRRLRRPTATREIKSGFSPPLGLAHSGRSNETVGSHHEKNREDTLETTSGLAGSVAPSGALAYGYLQQHRRTSCSLSAPIGHCRRPFGFVPSVRSSCAPEQSRSPMVRSRPSSLVRHAEPRQHKASLRNSSGGGPAVKTNQLTLERRPAK